jgi:hypothetical protein
MARGVRDPGPTSAKEACRGVRGSDLWRWFWLGAALRSAVRRCDRRAHVVSTHRIDGPESLDDQIALAPRHLQAVALPETRHSEVWRRRLADLGAARICPSGQLRSPEPTGRTTAAPMSRSGYGRQPSRADIASATGRISRRLLFFFWKTRNGR